MNWDDTRIFLALQREGTLRSAARVAGVDQATVGRRVAALERALGATLFLRTSEGYVLTPAGENALQSAEKMEKFADDLVRQAQGTDTRLAGEVKVTTTDTLALEFVIPSIARLHAEHPDVHVILNTSTQLLNLARREADIAIRNQKPENPDLVARRLARWPVGRYQYLPVQPYRASTLDRVRPYGTREAHVSWCCMCASSQRQGSRGPRRRCRCSAGIWRAARRRSGRRTGTRCSP